MQPKNWSKFPLDKITLQINPMILCFCLEYVSDSKIFYSLRNFRDGFFSERKFRKKVPMIHN